MRQKSAISTIALVGNTIDNINDTVMITLIIVKVIGIISVLVVMVVIDVIAAAVVVTKTSS